MRGIGEGKRGHHVGIANLYGAGCGKSYRLPYASVAVANCGTPIPAFSGDEGRAIETHDAAVFAGTAFHRLFLRISGMGRRRDPHGEHILSIGLYDIGDIKNATNECSL